MRLSARLNYPLRTGAPRKPAGALGRAGMAFRSRRPSLFARKTGRLSAVRCRVDTNLLLLNDDTIRDWHKLFEQRGIAGL